MYKILIFIICSLLCINNCYSQDKTIEHIGDVTQIAVPVTALAMTLIKKDKKGVWQFAKSYGTTFVITRI